MGNVDDPAHRPALGRDHKNAKVVEPGNPFRPASRGWITKDRTVPGHIGWPHLATPKKAKCSLVPLLQMFQSLLERMIRWDGISWEG